MGFPHRTVTLVKKSQLYLALTLCILAICITRTFQFNFETRVPVIKEGPSDSYFGFSVAEHVTKKRGKVKDSEPYSHSKLLVGAPIHNIEGLGYNSTGAVFSCPFSSHFNDCTVLELEQPGDTDTNKLRDFEWLGVTVKSQGKGGRVAACAHRYKEKSATEISPLGKCFLLEHDLTINDGEWIPCRGKTLGKDNFGYCQAGTGLAISRIGGPVNEDTEFIAGAPGAGNWMGALQSTTEGFKHYKTILDESSVGVKENSYLGFSAASAYIKSGKYSYVSGAPRANISGSVVILERTDGATKVIEYTKVLQTDHAYSSFGYDVTTADLDGDGFDDLIIGAPMYFDRKTETGGAVYVYMNEDQMGTFDGEPIKMTGKRDSRFGMTVTSLGDINKDGFHDFAVGAPYENDGQGAVYIYMGDETKWSEMQGGTMMEAQKITPMDFPAELQGATLPNATFGYSLSGGLDLDGNDFPDLLVGALDSNSVVVLRARPVINVTARLIVTPDELDAESEISPDCDGEHRCFNITICAKYLSSSYDFDEPVELLYDILPETVRLDLGLSSRVFFKGSDPDHVLKRQMLLLPPQTDEAENCSSPHTAYLRSDMQDIFRSIPIRVNFYLDNEGPGIPAPGEDLPNMAKYVMFDKGVITTVATEVEFTKDCAKDDGKCITDLHLKAAFQLEQNKDGVKVMKVGIDDQLKLDVKLDNMAEEAYDAKLMVEFPDILDFNRLEPGASERIRYGCGDQFRKDSENSTMIVVCKLGNPYPRAPEMDRFVMSFDATGVPPDQAMFRVKLNVTSTNDDESPHNNVEDLKVLVESVTDLNIDGLTPRDQYLFDGMIRGESAISREDQIGPLVTQEWTVFNSGPASVAGAMVTIQFPYEVSNGKWLLYLLQKPNVTKGKGDCRVDPQYINELGIEKCSPNCTEYSPKRGSFHSEDDYAYAGSKKNTGDIVLDCKRGTANCFNITCTLDEMTQEQGNNEATITIKARLWNSTFMEDYLYASDIRVKVHGKVEMEGDSYIIQTRTDNDKDVIIFQVVPPTISAPAPQPVSWWIILVAVICGIIILILLIIILWKIGFFRRHGGRQGGPCGFFERKTGYKYATVTQKQSGAKIGTEKTAYYDEMYNYNSS